MPELPEEAVEAVEQAIYARGDIHPEGYDMRLVTTSDARAVLQAIAPHIEAAVEERVRNEYQQALAKATDLADEAANLGLRRTLQRDEAKAALERVREGLLELALRLADTHEAIEQMTAGMDEDEFEAAEAMFPHSGLFSVLDYALRGDPGHGDEIKAEERRRQALAKHREYLRLPASLDSYTEQGE